MKVSNSKRPAGIPLSTAREDEVFLFEGKHYIRMADGVRPNPMGGDTWVYPCFCFETRKQVELNGTVLVVSLPEAYLRTEE